MLAKLAPTKQIKNARSGYPRTSAQNEAKVMGEDPAARRIWDSEAMAIFSRNAVTE
jgi:hypothetical protein